MYSILMKVEVTGPHIESVVAKCILYHHGMFFLTDALLPKQRAL